MARVLKILKMGDLHITSPPVEKISMSWRLWGARSAEWHRERGRSTTSHKQAGRLFLFTFPFETPKSCCVWRCFSGAGRGRRTIFFSSFASKKSSSTEKMAPRYEDSVWSKHFVGVREGSLNMPSFRPLLRQNTGNLDLISKRRACAMEPDEADAQTDNQALASRSVDGADRPAPVECDHGQVTESVHRRAAGMRTTSSRHHTWRPDLFFFFFFFFLACPKLSVWER